MIILTYFEDLGWAEHNSMLSLWKATWQENGWDPVVLDRSYAAMHPQYDRVLSVVSELPTVNDRGYETACWIRWLAFELYMDRYGRQWISDCDCINYGKAPIFANKLTVLNSDTPIGGVTNFGCMEVRHVTDRLVDPLFFAGKAWDENGKPHLSDMVFNDLLSIHISQWLGLEKYCDEECWYAAPVINYNLTRIMKAGLLSREHALAERLKMMARP